VRGNYHAVVNNTWYSILFDHKLTKLFSIENFSGAKHAGKVLIIIIILFLIIIIIINIFIIIILIIIIIKIILARKLFLSVQFKLSAYRSLYFNFQTSKQYEGKFHGKMLSRVGELSLAEAVTRKKVMPPARVTLAPGSP